MTDNKCAGGVELDGNKPCSVCGATPRDQCRREGRWISRILDEHKLLRKTVADLVTAIGDPCFLDHNGNCQAHFIEKPCRVALAREVLEDTA